MAISFPINPTVGQQHSIGLRTYEWDGDRWKAIFEAQFVDWQNINSQPTPTLTFGGDLTGSTTITDLTATTTLSGQVINDSHTHDTRYYTETEINTMMATLQAGAVATADKWTTARSITLSGDLSGTVSIDGSSNVTLSTTVLDDSHNHIIANVDGLQAALDSKQPVGSYLTTSTAFGGDVSGTYNNIVIANDSHTHDGRYYTEAEVNTLLAGKSDTSHGHAYLPLTGGTLTGDILVQKNNAWITVDSASTGGNGIEQGAGISIGESGYKGSASLHLTYTGDGFGHIGMGSVNATTNLPQYEALTFYYLDNTTRVNGVLSCSNAIDMNANQILLDTQKGFVNSGQWTRNSTPSGYIDFGPANTSYAHIYTGNPSFYFNKGIFSTGDVTAYASDKRLKENVEPIDKPLEKVLSLTGMTYTWNETANKLAGYDMSIKQVGVYAQDVQAVLPEAVAPAPFDVADGHSASGEDYLTVKYEKLVPLLIEAIKEQQGQIDSLKAELDNLKR